MVKVLALTAGGMIHSEVEVLKLGDLNECLDRVAKGGVRGKLIVHISD